MTTRTPSTEAPWPDARPPMRQTRRLLLGEARGVVARCRRFTSKALGDWGLPDGSAPETEDVLLLVSELVTNACLHAGGPEELRLEAQGSGRLRIAVRDASPVGPAPRGDRNGTLPGGHGLFIVARLSADWGWQPVSGGGKEVWAQVALPAPFGRTAGRPEERSGGKGEARGPADPSRLLGSWT